MPADYKYEFISTGRLKALRLASSRLRVLQKDLSASNVIVQEVLNRLEVIRALVSRANGEPVDQKHIQVLRDLLGSDLGAERVKR